MVLGDILVPGRTLARDVLAVLGASAAIAVSARICIPLPFSPVPVTAQTLTVLLTGILLGSRLGSLAVLAYLAEGAAGLPVFAAGGGLAYLAGPTGGYLAGFLAAAFVTGRLAESGWDRRPATAAAAMAVGNLLIYLSGFLWLLRFTGAGEALAAGIFPFLPGDLLKTGLATVALPLAWKVLRPFS
jgi:biotin transport system substrate-specific component